MKVNYIVKIFLDVVMTVLYTVLVFGFGTSLFFHEAAGLLIFILFAMHIILNFKWINNILRPGGFKKANIKNRLLFITDLVLLLGSVFIILTGVAVSRELFGFGLNYDTSALDFIHNFISYICLGAIAFHMSLHLKYLTSSVKYIAKNITRAPVVKTAASFFAVAAIMAVIYYQVYPYGGEKLFLTAVEAVAVDNSEYDAQNSEIYTEDETAVQTTDGTQSIDTEQSDKKKTEQTQADGSGNDSTSITLTLHDYLSDLFCTACHRHCSLLSPACARGVTKAEKAETEYYSEYESAEN